MNLNQLKIFYLAAKYGNLSIAAKDLNITQPAVTKGIQRIQEHYDVMFTNRFGKNCLLITPRFGPRIRLASVLTDCELEAGNIIEGSCGDCRVCIDACPVDALKGVEFRESEGVEKRLDVNACGNYRDGADSGARRGAHVCALCLAMCPKGQSTS